MKKLYFLLFTILISSLSFGQEAVITGYVDSPCSSAYGRTVEIYVNGTIDFTGWSLVRQANGGGFTTNLDISSFGTLTDEFAYITNNATTLNNEFGISTNVINNSGISDNGDDAFQLFDGTNVIDRSGEINVDGTGTAWDHEDTYYYRVNGTPANGGSFSSAQFTYGALQLLDGKGLCNSDSALSSYVPFGSYSITGSTDPTLSLVGQPASGSTVNLSPEDLNGELEFATTNFVVATPPAGDGYIVWDITNVTDGNTLHDFGSIYDTSSTYAFATLDPNKTYLLTAELVDINGTSLSSPVVYTLTANTNGYNVVSDLAALRAHVITNGEGLYYQITGETVITYQVTENTRHQKYIQDISAGILIDDPNDILATSFNIGDGISGLKGQTTSYNGVLEFIPTTSIASVSSTGNIINPQVISASELFTNGEDYESELIKVTNITFSDAGGTFTDNTNYNIVDGGTTTVCRVAFGDEDLIGATIPTGTSSVIGLVAEFSSAYQIYPRYLSDVEGAALSTKFNQIQGFSMYPNPTSLGYVTLSSKNNANMNVAVYDMLGKQVLNKTVTNNKLDVTSLNSGVYIMKVSQDNASVTKKLVIQ